MDFWTMAEMAYHNGYEQGKKEILQEYKAKLTDVIFKLETIIKKT